MNVTLHWLLEPENPSVRYWALVDLLGQPPDAPEVQETRSRIAQQPLVQDLFARQHPDGHWEDATKPYTARGTLGVLQVLHMLGVEPDRRTSAACNSFLRHCQHKSGGFSLTKTWQSALFPCTTGQHLPLLVYFGLKEDERVHKAFTFLIEDMSNDDTLTCGRYQHRDCLWGAIASLNGLAMLPDDMHSPRSQHVIHCLVNALLDAHYDFDGEHKRWLTFGVPRAWDLLSALRVLAWHGYAVDRRFIPLFDLFLSCRNEQDRWLCGSISRTWPFERRNRPSKWVTLDALRLLKRTKIHSGGLL